MIAIIGGGLSGLICGKILSENGAEVKVFEASESVGGLARCFEYNGIMLPVFYHHIFSHDSTTLKVMKDLGIDEFHKKRIKMGLCFENKIYEISWIKTLFWDFLGLKDKFRFGRLAIKTKLKKDWKDLEGKNAEEWLMKEVGKNVMEKIFAPLMREKYGLALEEISASELAMRLKEGEATGKFLYPKQSLHAFLDKLKKSVEKRGEVKCSAPVTKIKLSEKIHKIEYMENGKKKTTEARIIITSIPVPAFLEITKGLPRAYRERLSKVKYCSNISVNIFYQEPLSDLYWINVFDKSFGGVIEHTNLVDTYDFKFSWIWKYAPGKLWNLDDEKIARIFINEVKEIFPALKVFDYKVFRCSYASPIYDKNYAKYMPHIKTPLKNLFFTGVSTTYPEIRTMNTALESGIKTAKLCLGEMG